MGNIKRHHLLVREQRHSLPTLSRSLVALLVAGLSAHSAFAQDTASPSSPAVDDTAQDPDQFCRDNWFALWRCRDRHWAGPEVLLGVDLGVSAMNEGGPVSFKEGVGAVTHAGPAWGIRAGVELFPWLAIEARYAGIYNAARASASPTGRVGFLTTASEGVVRLTAPLPFVHPYLFGGVGYYDISLIGTPSAKAGSVFNSSSQPGIPLGFGLDVPLTWHLSLGVEATYHYLIGESFSSVTTSGIDGGDLSTVNAVLCLRL